MKDLSRQLQLGEFAEPRHLTVWSLVKEKLTPQWVNQSITLLQQLKLKRLVMPDADDDMGR